MRNLEYGCAIGYSGPQLLHCFNNLSSAFQHPAVLNNALASDSSARKILGPFKSSPLPYLCCPGLGVIPTYAGRWHTNEHLSATHRSSINDSINPEQNNTHLLACCSVDDAFAIVNTLGKGALMAKMNLKCFPSYPRETRGLELDWHMLEKQYYIDKCLPFDLLECSNNLMFMLSYCKHIRLKAPPLAFYSWVSSLTPQTCKQVDQKNASKIFCPYCCSLNFTANAQNSNFFHS